MRVFYILYGLLLVSPCFSIPTGGKLLRDLLKRNERNADGQEDKVDTELLGSSKHPLYEMRNPLPVCNSTKPPANGDIECEPFASDDEFRFCVASCKENYGFNGADYKMGFFCTITKQDDTSNNFVDILSCTPREDNVYYVFPERDERSFYETRASLPDCDSINSPTNGFIACMLNSPDEEVGSCVLSCKENYEFADGSNINEITCATGKQDDTSNKLVQTPSCKPKQDTVDSELLERSKHSLYEKRVSLPVCNSINPPENGDIKCLIDSPDDDFGYCEVSCKENYWFENGNNRIAFYCTTAKQDDALNNFVDIPSCIPRGPID